MGEFQRATYAYMIYTDENGVMEGDPEKPTIPAIYKVRVGQVAEFKRKFDEAGAKWVPVYSLLDFTDSISLKSDTEDDNAESD